MKMKKQLQPIWKFLIKSRSIWPRQPVDPSLSEEKGVFLLVSMHLINWIFIYIPTIAMALAALWDIPK